MTREQVLEYQEVFQTFDRNADGEINATDLKGLYGKLDLGKALTDSDIAELLKEAGENGAMR